MNTKKIVSYTKRSLLFLILGMVGLLLVLYALLWIPPVQQTIKSIALTQVMKLTGNRIEIGNLYLRPFNKLQLDHVYMEDQRGDTLIYADRLAAGVDLWSLLDKQLLINTVSADDFYVQVNCDSLGAPFNFQFLIDAFASEEPDTTSSDFRIRIDDITLRQGRIRYDVRTQPTAESGEFDFNHILLSDIEANINLNSIDLEALDIKLNKLKLKEKSGLTVEAKAKVTSEGEKIVLRDLELKLPRSLVSVPSAELEAFEAYSLRLGESHIHPHDLQPFHADLQKLAEPLIFSGKAEGKLPTINLSQLDIRYGNQIALNLQASVDDYEAWQTSPLSFLLNNLYVNPQGLTTAMDFASGGDETPLPVNTGAITLQGRLDGSLPDLHLQVNAQTDRGSLDLKGTAGYLFEEDDIHFDLAMQADSFDIATLLRDTLFGEVQALLTAHGTYRTGTINTTARLAVDHFDFNDYRYNSLQADALYRGDSIRLELTSADPNIPIELWASGNIGKKHPGLELYTRIDRLNVDTLNFLPDYKDFFASTVIQAQVKGFDPERMEARLDIDSLFLETEKGTFRQDAFAFNYTAADSSSKRMLIRSELINAQAGGNFTFAGLLESFENAFPALFGQKAQPQKKPASETEQENLNFFVMINKANTLSDILNVPQAIPDSIYFLARYKNVADSLQLNARAFTRFASDTILVSANLANRNEKMDLGVSVENRSNNYDIDGSLETEISFLPQPGASLPYIYVDVKQTDWNINDTSFFLNPAQIAVEGDRYTIRDFSFNRTNDEYIKLNGVISPERGDSLNLMISNFSLGTIFGAMKADLPLSAVAHGEVTARQVMTTPIVMTRGFNINDIVFSGHAIGNLNLVSAWSTERNGLALRATLDQKDYQPSVVSAYYQPDVDSLNVRASIRDIQLQWIDSFVGDLVYGIAGNIGADITAKGTLSDPSVEGKLFFNQATAGVTMLDTHFSINDSILIHPNAVELKNFRILDSKQQAVTVNGNVKHSHYANFVPHIDINLDNFLVIDNAQQVDSLFFGTLRLKGDLNIRQTNHEWVLGGNLGHAPDSKIMINIPNTASAAQRYNIVTYVNSQGEVLDSLLISKNREAMAFSFPIRINMMLELDDDLTAGVVYNSATRDAAVVSGHGVINVTYDLASSDIKLLGDYTVQKGEATLSLAGITTKTFYVDPGGKVTFAGDPLKSSFAITALYNVRADLSTLDESFADQGRVPVVCAISVTGDMNNMAITYDIKLPNQPDDIQRRVNNLLYTDDIKLRQIAFLLATGAFRPVQDNQSKEHSNLWASISSMGVTSLLNSMLAGVLDENWSVGTEIRTTDGSFSDVEMDVNISTQLFDNRVTVNSTLGYRNSNNSSETFSGDFEIDYKLVPSGNVILRTFNRTNDNRFDTRARTTQGVGVIYKREARTFRKLFDRFKKEQK